MCSCTVSECWQYQYYYLWCRGIRKSEAKRWKCDSKQNSKLNKLRKWLRELKFKIGTKPQFKHPMSSVTNRLLSRKINLKAIAITLSNTHLIFVSCSFSNFWAVSSLSTISISFSSVNLTKVSLRASRSAATDSAWDLKRKISYLTILQLSVLKKRNIKIFNGRCKHYLRHSDFFLHHRQSKPGEPLLEYKRDLPHYRLPNNIT